MKAWRKILCMVCLSGWVCSAQAVEVEIVNGALGLDEWVTDGNFGTEQSLATEQGERPVTMDLSRAVWAVFFDEGLHFTDQPQARLAPGSETTSGWILQRKKGDLSLEFRF